MRHGLINTPTAAYFSLSLRACSREGVRIVCPPSAPRVPPQAPAPPCATLVRTGTRWRKAAARHRSCTRARRRSDLTKRGDDDQQVEADVEEDRLGQLA